MAFNTASQSIFVAKPGRHGLHREITRWVEICWSHGQSFRVDILEGRAAPKRDPDRTVQQVRKVTRFNSGSALKDVKGIKKGFSKYISSKRKTREYVGLLLNGAGELVTKDMQKAKALNAFFASVFIGPAFRNPRHLRPEKKSGARNLVEEDQVPGPSAPGSGALKQTGHIGSPWALMGCTHKC
ncbi:LOW QUALITY PROTEIN: hypothetical protein QYF61_012005 [Mycteria americana]|uniref:Uncharacterized protein n=1 Tax=Mycteria americana TaxID=33587 RepID=A0AAN7NCC6_MYCAM|nr:LOW QUALITY PROTEIN: hypothetical protein QYF61_012005 [Mycteria americana]